jgi:hypothetical protein
MKKKYIRNVVEKYTEQLNDNFGGCELIIKSNNFKKMINDLFTLHCLK